MGTLEREPDRAEGDISSGSVMVADPRPVCVCAKVFVCRHVYGSIGTLEREPDRAEGDISSGVVMVADPRHVCFCVYVYVCVYVCMCYEGRR